MQEAHINKQMEAKILRPLEYSGNVYGDWGYSINGTKSRNGYFSKAAARFALERALIKRNANK